MPTLIAPAAALELAYRQHVRFWRHAESLGLCPKHARRRAAAYRMAARHARREA